MPATSINWLLPPLTAPFGSLQAVRPAGNAAVLTYDDGPQPGSTDKILAELAAAHATATFFVLVGRARRYPSLLADVIAGGHDIALHGIDHVRLTTLSPLEVRRRTLAGRHELEDLVQRPVRWFRPPYGAQQRAHWAAIRSTGLDSVVWSNDVADWQDDPVGEIAARANTVRRGSVLLMHDGYADEHDNAYDGPAPTFDRGELTRQIVCGLADRGLQGMSLSRALASGSKVRAAWFCD